MKGYILKGAAAVCFGKLVSNRNLIFDFHGIWLIVIQIFSTTKQFTTDTTTRHHLFANTTLLGLGLGFPYCPFWTHFEATIALQQQQQQLFHSMTRIGFIRRSTSEYLSRLLLVCLLLRGPSVSALNNLHTTRRARRNQGMALRSNPSPTGDESDSSSQFSMPSLGRLSIGSESELSFKFGVVADIQYAPIPDGYSFAGILRYYRHSLEVARHAAQHFESDGADLVLNLGDIIDGKCQAITENGGEPLPEGVDPGVSAIDDVLEALSVYKQGPILHTYGNHELYNLDRETIGEKLNIPFKKEPCGDLVGYWTHLNRGIRFVTIDSYDVTKNQRCKETSKKYKQASNILAKENPNYPHNDNSGEGLEGEDQRFVAFNGGVGAPQLEWLRETLSSARDSGEKVVLISHQPILPGSSSSICLIWNYDEVLAVLRDFSDVVIASFAGHAHSGGYKRDESGIHFRTFEAALEHPDPHKTYAMVDVYDDCLVVQGFGGCASACYDFEHLTTSPKGTFKASKVPA